jgi:hypothetical protein
VSDRTRIKTVDPSEILYGNLAGVKMRNKSFVAVAIVRATTRPVIAVLFNL